VIKTLSGKHHWSLIVVNKRIRLWRSCFSLYFVVPALALGVQIGRLYPGTVGSSPVSEIVAISLVAMLLGNIAYIASNEYSTDRVVPWLLILSGVPLLWLTSVTEGLPLEIAGTCLMWAFLGLLVPWSPFFKQLKNEEQFKLLVMDRIDEFRDEEERLAVLALLDEPKAVEMTPIYLDDTKFLDLIFRLPGLASYFDGIMQGLARSESLRRAMIRSPEKVRILSQIVTTNSTLGRELLKQKQSHPFIAELSPRDLEMHLPELSERSMTNPDLVRRFFEDRQAIAAREVEGIEEIGIESIELTATSTSEEKNIADADLDIDPDLDPANESSIRLLSPTANIDEVIVSNKQHLEDLIAGIKQGRTFVPFVGAGVSMKYGLPGWTGFLVSQQVAAAHRRRVQDWIDQGRFEDAAEELSDLLGSREFCDSIRASFLVDPEKYEFTGALDALPRIFPHMVVTTNFDRFLEHAYAMAGFPFEEITHGAARDTVTEAIQSQSHTMWKIHGDAAERTRMVLTRQDYDQEYGEDNSGPLGILMRHLCSRNLVFIGCSLAHDRTMQILYKTTLNNPSMYHFAILEQPAKTEEYIARKRQISIWGIRPIWYPQEQHKLVDELLSYIATHVEEKSSAPPSLVTQVDASSPEPGEHRVRQGPRIPMFHGPDVEDE